MTVLKPKNIYYMLSYAYHVLNEGTFKDVDSEDFENIHNLFAEIIYLGVSNQIKRGINREYEEYTYSIGAVRGRINIRESLLTLTGNGDKIVCTFDEYTPNSPMNRVIKTTMQLLIDSEDVDSNRKIRLRSLMKYFGDVELTNPQTVKWKSFRYHRNNATYKMLMNVCYLIISGMILSDASGAHRLSEYIDDQKMHALYERFLFAYFKKHHPEFNVEREKIRWNIDDDAGTVIDFLPDMRTDITIRYQKRVLIIDAKYYSEILVKTQYSDRQKMRSANLYQIYSYVKNMDADKNGSVEGMLLYAGTGEELPENLSAVFDGNKIHVRSLDLSGEWKEITAKLENIADEFKCVVNPQKASLQ
ncbi:MAG: 5-methylcytosine-specific restriction endonuclease system specificity protein McrC [Methanomicrobium sp.]|nr:5-methylcytosine-specific restriction endonuclease system specificity protein McrC [Methanomicrobium sp.]